MAWAAGRVALRQAQTAQALAAVKLTGRGQSWWQKVEKCAWKGAAKKPFLQFIHTTLLACHLANRASEAN